MRPSLLAFMLFAGCASTPAHDVRSHSVGFPQPRSLKLQTALALREIGDLQGRLDFCVDTLVRMDVAFHTLEKLCRQDQRDMP